MSRAPEPRLEANRGRLARRGMRQYVMETEVGRRSGDGGDGTMPDVKGREASPVNDPRYDQGADAVVDEEVGAPGCADRGGERGDATKRDDQERGIEGVQGRTFEPRRESKKAVSAPQRTMKTRQTAHTSATIGNSRAHEHDERADRRNGSSGDVLRVTRNALRYKHIRVKSSQRPSGHMGVRDTSRERRGG